MKGRTKRKFLTYNSKIVANIIRTITFGKYPLFSLTTKTNDVQINKSHYGSKNKNGYKTLVAYESQFGSTSEVANAIGKVLSQDGNVVEIKKLEEVNDLTAYNKIVIGSAIQYDKWMPEARRFIKTNQNILSKLPVAFFFTCLVLAKQTDSAIQKANGYSDKLHNLVPQVKPVSVGRFAGVLDYSKMSFFSRIIAKGLFSVIGVKEGDYRDWNIIRLWAKEICFKI